MNTVVQSHGPTFKSHCGIDQHSTHASVALCVLLIEGKHTSFLQRSSTWFPRVWRCLHKCLETMAGSAYTYWLQETKETQPQLQGFNMLRCLPKAVVYHSNVPLGRPTPWPVHHSLEANMIGQKWVSQINPDHHCLEVNMSWTETGEWK